MWFLHSGSSVGSLPISDQLCIFPTIFTTLFHLCAYPNDLYLSVSPTTCTHMSCAKWPSGILCLSFSPFFSQSFHCRIDIPTALVPELSAVLCTHLIFSSIHLHIFPYPGRLFCVGYPPNRIRSFQCRYYLTIPTFPHRLCFFEKLQNHFFLIPHRPITQ